MKLIVISKPENFQDEAGQIESLFRGGLDTFHLRKPEQSEKEFEKTLRSIPSVYYKQIIIHSHYKLIEKYNLKGIHLTGRFIKSVPPDSLKMIIDTIHKRNLKISASFHAIDELRSLEMKLDYIFLGPLFNSISKEGYTSKINFEEGSTFLKESKRNYSIIALGGIEASNIEKVKAAGFDGAALLGAIWKQGVPADNFTSIKKELGND